MAGGIVPDKDGDEFGTDRGRFGEALHLVGNLGPHSSGDGGTVENGGSHGFPLSRSSAGDSTIVREIVQRHLGIGLPKGSLAPAESFHRELRLTTHARSR